MRSPDIRVMGNHFRLLALNHSSSSVAQVKRTAVNYGIKKKAR